MFALDPSLMGPNGVGEANFTGKEGDTLHLPMFLN
jgi:hypothetical protein